MLTPSLSPSWIFFPTSTVSKPVMAGIYIFPCLVFATFFALGSSGWMHRYMERYVFIFWIFVWIIYALVFLYTSYWFSLGYRRFLKWKIIYMSLTFIALTWAYLQADSIYYGWATPVYALRELATYVSIDPSIERGQSYMDSGKVYFKDGVRVAVENARAYKQKHLYCVAPIVGKPLESSADGGATSSESKLFTLPASGTVDFWAVGVDCCDANGKNFKCGQISDPKAHAGMRLLRDDHRLFYRLAVQQWASEFHLPSLHPLFFYWVRDPVGEVQRFESNFDNAVWLHLSTFALTNALLAFILYILIPEWLVTFVGDAEPLLTVGARTAFQRKMAMMNQQKLFGIKNENCAVGEKNPAFNGIENKLLTWNEEDQDEGRLMYIGDYQSVGQKM